MSTGHNVKLGQQIGLNHQMFLIYSNYPKANTGWYSLLSFIDQFDKDKFNQRYNINVMKLKYMSGKFEFRDYVDYNYV